MKIAKSCFLFFFEHVAHPYTYVFHLTDDLSLPFEHVRCGVFAVEFARIRQRRSDEGGLCLGEAVGMSAKVLLRHGFRAVYAFAHLNAVEVYLEYAFLGPQGFDEHGEIAFEAFAQPSAVGPEKNIFGCLLRYGACSALSAAAFGLFDGLFDGIHVKSVVIQKTLVLACYAGDG